MIKATNVGNMLKNKKITVGSIKYIIGNRTKKAKLAYRIESFDFFFLFSVIALSSQQLHYQQQKHR